MEPEGHLQVQQRYPLDDPSPNQGKHAEGHAIAYSPPHLRYRIQPKSIAQEACCDQNNSKDIKERAENFYRGQNSVYHKTQDGSNVKKLQIINRDKEIQEMIRYIHDKTGKWEGLLFWEGETVEECRERLRKRVKELKKKD